MHEGLLHCRYETLPRVAIAASWAQARMFTYIFPRDRSAAVSRVAEPLRVGAGGGGPELAAPLTWPPERSRRHQPSSK